MAENTSKVTVAIIMESLKKLPPDMPFEVSIGQHNKVYPIAYVNPIAMGSRSDPCYVICQNGHDARMIVHLPSDDNETMVTKIIKRK